MALFDHIYFRGWPMLFDTSQPVVDVDHFDYAVSREWPSLSEFYAFPAPQIVSQEYA